jgi:Ca-activated chloride channel family protein
MRFQFLPWVALLIALMAGASEGAEPRVDPPPPRLAAHGAPPIRVDVKLALVPVTVTDALGRNVLGLARQNFRVLDGSEPRPIVSFNRQDAPISVGLVFDCSASMADKFRVSRQAPAQLFAQLNPDDEAFLITVADRAVLRQDFTSDFEEIENVLLFTHPAGSTSLLDGVYLGLQKLKRAHNPHKALIVVSDGGENSSRYKMRELSALAVESDAQIFSICLFYQPGRAEELQGPDLLSKLSELTGGARFIVSAVNQMPTAMTQIGATLHNEYVLGIVPPPAAPQGKFRRIKVQLVVPAGTPQLSIRARTSYYVP